MRTDGQTDGYVIGAFRDYANARNKLKTKLRPTGIGRAPTGSSCEYGDENFGFLKEGWPTSTHRRATQFVRTRSRAALMCTHITYTEKGEFMFCRPVMFVNLY